MEQTLVPQLQGGQGDKRQAIWVIMLGPIDAGVKSNGKDIEITLPPPGGGEESESDSKIQGTTRNNTPNQAG